MEKVRTHCHCGNTYVMVPKDDVLAGKSVSCGEPFCKPPVDVSKPQIDASETAAPQKGVSHF